MIQVYVEMIRELWNSKDEGQGMVEYALILALISVIAIAALTLIGEEVMAALDEVGAAF